MTTLERGSTTIPFIAGAMAVEQQPRSEENQWAPSTIELLARIRSQRRATVLTLGTAMELDGPFPDSVRACLVLPWFEGERLDCHLVVLAGAGLGTFETWEPVIESPYGGPPTLGLGSGYFGGLNDFFRVSSITRFNPGEGLPGQAIASASPVVFGSLATSTAFLRVAAAQSAGLGTGLALPVAHPLGADVAAILLGQSEAGAVRIDVWMATMPPQPRLEDVTWTNLDEKGAMALQLAELTAKSGKPQVLTSNEQTSAGRRSLGFSWIAPGLTSIARIVTVVA